MKWLIIFGVLGGVLGLILFPIGLWIYTIIRNTNQRRAIKRALKKGQVLKPIDPKDFDYIEWTGKTYGNIDIDPQELKNFNNRIFKKSVESSDDVFFIKIKDYVKEARKLGYTDEQIKEEFRKKSYTEDLINIIFEQYV